VPSTRTERTVLHELRYLILAAQREGSRRLGDSLRHLELTPAQAEVLDVLSLSQPVTLAELGRLLVCEAGSPSRLVDSLVRRGLVDRVPHEQDKRAVLIELTAAGRELAARLEEATGRLTDEIANRLEPGDAEDLRRLLHVLLRGTDGGFAIDIRFPADLHRTRSTPDPS
jgi:DNA-binding MarR family transcriptional regulator